MADLISNYQPKPKKTVPPSFSNAPKPQITMPPAVSKTYTPTPRATKTPIDKPSTPEFKTDTSTVTTPINTPVITKKPTPKPTPTPTPKPTIFNPPTATPTPTKKAPAPKSTFKGSIGMIGTNK